MADTLRKYKIWEPLLLSFATVVGMLAGAKLVEADHRHARQETAITDTHYSGRQVEEIIRFLETKYVGQVNSDELVTKAIHSILEGLDPHTHYFPPDQMEELEERTSGHYVGIGVEVTFVGDSLMVLYPRKDSPAERAGIKGGDYIIAVNGLDIVKGDSLKKKEVLELIKGEKGSKVRLTIKPLLEQTTRIVEVDRGDIKVPSVVAAYMVDSSIAYIRVQRFTNTTYREFMDAWERMSTKENARHLILDLRDNPGGYLKEAVNILSQIIEEEGKLLVYTEGKNHQRIEYKSTGKIFFPVGNVTVLINSSSASASEIIAGCLQDLDRGLIVGTPSFGKGLVQEQYELSNGGILRLTVSKYYTPSGRLIQRAYDSTSVVDTNIVFRTAQGRPMHAGGGIVPDIIVAEDIDWENPLLQQWMDYISEYAIRYDLKQFGNTSMGQSDVEKVRSKMPDDQTILDGITLIARTRSSDSGKEALKFLADHRNELLRITRASIVSYKTGEEGWYRTLNEQDPVVVRAIALAGVNLQMALKGD